jgi:hypothetical protein
VKSYSTLILLILNYACYNRLEGESYWKNGWVLEKFSGFIMDFWRDDTMFIIHIKYKMWNMS